MEADVAADTNLARPRNGKINVISGTFPVNLRTPINSQLNTDHLLLQSRLQEGMDEDLIQPVALDACMSNVQACDFDGGVTPIMDLFGLANPAEMSVESVDDGIRIASTVTLGRVNIVGFLQDKSGNAVQKTLVTARCYDTAIAFARTDDAGRFNVLVTENLAFDLECNLFASVRGKGKADEALVWTDPEPGTLMLQQALVLK
jgi:hypothetical protein